MKQKFLIFLALIVLIITLIGLNAASYTQKDKMPDSELSPNRSTFNTGATGTRAFYDLLAETGRRPTRWQEPPSALSIKNKNQPQTFILIGRTRRSFDAEEKNQLLRWVAAGGKLVIIDREPPIELLKTTGNWRVSADAAAVPPFINSDPSDPQQMTEKIVAAKPIQPTLYTSKVNAVQPSRFASSVNFKWLSDENYSTTGETSAPKSPARNNDYDNETTPPPREADSKNEPVEGISSNKNAPIISIEKSGTINAEPVPTAPVAHLANNEKTLLADFPYGEGQIVFLTDPYIVSNGGISLVDNAQLALNIVASREGVIAFDEFHQGYGSGENQLLEYFAGTPLAAIFLQFAALAGLILFSQSRRFARPLPVGESNRLSKLEYVSAMAELQQRARAYDLAIENIYKDFRRRVSRLVGVDNSTISYKDLAKLIAGRGNFNSGEIENLMYKCEDIIHGEPTGKREVLELTRRLRELEEKLGLRRVRKQFFGN